MKGEICLEVWGDFACFTPPYAKVERLTYPVPTPSAVRGILSSIYCKPVEFYWQVTKIEVLNPIRYMSFMRNEVKSTVSVKSDVSDSILYTDEDRTQRQTQVLKDVRYRITARICPREEYCGTLEQLYCQAMRRIRGGKAFCQPSLGLREFVCYFEESDGTRQPIDVSMDLGLMVYDVFDLHDSSIRAKAQPRLSLYHAVMEHGVIRVPDYDSDEVLKGGYSSC
ncbi:MAG: type I-C CRISPR-associated protein Cas5c [Oscillospiraceae bacterium]|nr:type I-C CRISPR-associated protein Cas5c [Oscillospiraceae bacterium]